MFVGHVSWENDWKPQIQYNETAWEKKKKKKKTRKKNNSPFNLLTRNVLKVRFWIHILPGDL